MSYFEDQYEAWMDNDCQGDLMEINPDLHWADKIQECESRGHGKIKVEKIQTDDDGKVFRKAKVCQDCKCILN